LIVGIDFGSKLAGTTAICFGANPKKLTILTSNKNEDADQFILDFCKHYQPTLIGIDAPLSLPSGIMTGKGDFFYRKCDKELKAMSPMFLGGLTARAMKLRSFLKSEYNISIIEVYPKAQVLNQSSQAQAIYKSKDMEQNFLNLINLENLDFHGPLRWHEVDSCLAWLTAHKYSLGTALAYGIENEGLIFA
jgi:uncharacterized protein